MMPSFFMGHGSPMIAISDNAYTRFLGELGTRFQPKAIVLFSAHWEQPAQTISAVEQYGTIYDFGGFPEALSQVTYPAPGNVGLAEQISAMLTAAAIPNHVDRSRGLDHGAWALLRKLYPDANVPVVAMSVNPGAAPADQYRVGKAVDRLRADDIMVIGSGATVHNFQTMRRDAPDAPPDDWAVQFDDWITSRASKWDLTALFDYNYLAPHAHRAVPEHGHEHFVPLFYAMGAADDQRTARELFRWYEFGSLSYAVWQFGG
jgi:4,5-DOPA dioxygenase extradiol